MGSIPTPASISGVYRIENIETGQFLVGSSVDVRRRLLAHRASLRRGRHENRHLQAAWDKYGEETFLFGLADEYDQSDLLEMEQRFIASHGYYNINRVAGRPPSRKGQVNSPEHREKCRLANLGKKLGPHSAEWNERIRMSNIGKKRSAGFGARMSAVLTGRRLSLEHRAAIRAGHQRRKQ